MTEERLVLAELLEKAGDGDFLGGVAEAVPSMMMPFSECVLSSDASAQRVPVPLVFRRSQLGLGEINRRPPRNRPLHVGALGAPDGLETLEGLALVFKPEE
jgi:hypothetical protein